MNRIEQQKETFYKEGQEVPQGRRREVQCQHGTHKAYPVRNDDRVTHSVELPECSTSNNNELSNDNQNYSVFPIISNGHCTIDEVYPQDSLSENNSVNDSLSINANSQTNPVNNVNKDSISYLGLKVINLSKVNITESQEKVLIKGITFVPTPETADRAQIHQDVSDFCRRLRLKLHFSAPLPAIDEIFMVVES